MTAIHQLLPTVINAYRWAALLGVCLLSSCNPAPAVTFNPVEARTKQAAGSLPDLRFDWRYDDFT